MNYLMSHSTFDYTPFFAKAHTAVAGIKEDSIRSVAFGVVLTHLLGETSQGVKKPLIDETPAEKRVAKKVSKSGPKAWLVELVNEGFFSTPRSSADIRQELSSRSHILAATAITQPLEALCHEKLLRRSPKSPDGKKSGIHWHNW